MSQLHKRADRAAIRPARELVMWLRALPSFFNIRNHPLSEKERAGILSRDFTPEARVTMEVLLRCSQLLFGLTQEGAAAEPAAAAARGAQPGAAAEDATGDEHGLSTDDEESLVSVAGTVRDACDYGSVILGAPAVSYGQWSSFGSRLLREFNGSEAVRALTARAELWEPSELQQMLNALTELKAPDALGADMNTIFSGLLRLLDNLRFVETSLSRDYPLKQLLPIFTLIREEAKDLLDTIENRALHAEGVGVTLQETLDGTAYAIRMELRKAFEHELIGLSTMRQAPQIYAKVENAHGLLRDSFQQSVVSLAQMFDPSLDGKGLFSTFETKIEQSLALRGDLWRLLVLVRQVAHEGDERPRARLLEGVAAFREGSLRHLMYKDWESYERFVEEIDAARGVAEFVHVLHRFEAYLETLFGQVNMRAALANHPFEPDSDKEKA